MLLILINYGQSWEIWGVHAACEKFCQKFCVCFVIERESIAFVAFSKGTLHGEVVKKFSFKSFLEQCYLYSLDRTQKERKVVRPDSEGRLINL